MNLPNNIYSGNWKKGHVQGIAVDTERGFAYYSFTTILLKTDLQGNALASVKNIIGHLGCIAFDKENNRVYGSLELKHDSIGRGVMAQTGIKIAEEDAFYLVSFDLDKLDRMEMDAEKDGIMSAVYVRDVVKDYTGIDPLTGLHDRYAAFLRSPDGIRNLRGQTARKITDFFDTHRAADHAALVELSVNYDTLVTRYAVLSAILAYADDGGGSRGSYLIENHPEIDTAHRDKVLRTFVTMESGNIGASCTFEDVRPIPEISNWFEEVYNNFGKPEMFR